MTSPTYLDLAPLPYATARLDWQLEHAIGNDRPILPGDAVSPVGDSTLVGTYLGRTRYSGAPVVRWERQPWE